MARKPTYVIRALVQCPGSDSSILQTSLEAGRINVLSYGQTGFLVDVTLSAEDDFEAVRKAAAELRARGTDDLRLIKLVSIRAK